MLFFSLCRMVKKLLYISDDNALNYRCNSQNFARVFVVLLFNEIQISLRKDPLASGISSYKERHEAREIMLFCSRNLVGKKVVHAFTFRSVYYLYKSLYRSNFLIEKVQAKILLLFSRRGISDRLDPQKKLRW